MWRKGSPLILVIGVLGLSQVFCCSTAGGNSCINPNDRVSKTPTTPGNPQPTILTPTPTLLTPGPSPTPSSETTAVQTAATATPTPTNTQGGAFLPEQRNLIRPENANRPSGEWRPDVEKTYDTVITLLAPADSDAGGISFSTVRQ